MAISQGPVSDYAISSQSKATVSQYLPYGVISLGAASQEPRAHQGLYSPLYNLLGMTVTPIVDKTAVTSPWDFTSPFVFPIFELPQTSYVIRRQYWTDIIVSRENREQRRAMRRVPRRTLEMTSQLTGARWLDFSRLISKAQRVSCFMADESRVTTLSGASSGVVFPLTSVPTWIQAGQALVLADFVNKRYGFARVNTVGSNSFNATAIPDAAWASTTRVYAAMQGWLASQLDTQMSWFKVTAPKMTFNEQPDTVLDEPTEPAYGTYKSREVFLWEPNGWVPVQISNIAMMEAVDYGLGSLNEFDISGFTQRIFQASYSMHEDDANLLRGLFDRMKGQQGEFYMPTFERDLTPATTAASGTNTMTVAGTLPYRLFNGSNFYRNVAVFLTEGRYPTCQFNRATSITLDGSWNSVLTFEDNWTQDIVAATKVSWMPCWRFATDILEFEWLMNTNLDRVVTAKTSMILLEDLAVET